MSSTPRRFHQDILSRADKVFRAQGISWYDCDLDKTRRSVKSNKSAYPSKVLIEASTRAMGCGVRMCCNHCGLTDEDMLIRRNGLGFAIYRDIMGLVPALRK